MHIYISIHSSLGYGVTFPKTKLFQPNSIIVVSITPMAGGGSWDFNDLAAHSEDILSRNRIVICLTWAWWDIHLPENEDGELMILWKRDLTGRWLQMNGGLCTRKPAYDTIGSLSFICQPPCSCVLIVRTKEPTAFASKTLGSGRMTAST